MDPLVTTEESALYKAVHNRDVKWLVELLEQGESSDLQDENGNTALHLATSLGNTEAVDVLLENCFNLDLQNELGETPLHIAIIRRNEGLVGKLLKGGANHRVLDNRGHSALSLAVLNNFEAAVDLFIQQRYIVVHRTNTNGYTCYHILIIQKNIQLLEKFIKHGSVYGLNVKDDNRRSPLQLAILEGFQRGFELLLEKTRYLCDRDDNGHTILHTAVLKKDCTILEQLINKMSDLYTKDKKRKSALDLAISNNMQQAVCLFLRKGVSNDTDNSDEPSYPVHMAVIEKKKKLLRRLLSSDDCEIDSKDNQGRTPLHWATMRRFAAGIKLLLSKGADSNAADAFGNTPLYYSVLDKCVGSMATLIGKGADINHQNSDRISPIHLAVSENFQAGVKLLLARGAEVSVINLNGNTLLHTAVLSRQLNGNKIFKMLLMHEDIGLDVQNDQECTALHLAVKEGLESVVDLLLAKGVNLNVPDMYSHTPLHTAVLSSQLNGNKIFKMLLMHEDIDLDDQNDQGCTALHLAVKEGLESVVDLLLAKGVNLNVPDIDGYTPLHTAVCQENEKRNIRIITKLCEMGVDFEIKTSSSETPLHLACFNNYTEAVKLLLEKGAAINETCVEGNTALHYAVKQSCDQEECMLIVHILLNNGADIHDKNLKEESVLHIASSCGYESIVSVLIERGADVHELDYRQRSVLHKAVKSKNIRLVEQFLILGLDPNIKDDKGTPPLHVAVSKSFDKAVKLLVEYGANVNYTGDEGCSALIEAASLSTRSVLEYLLSHGADINQKNDTGTALHSAVNGEHYANLKFLLKYNINVNEVDSEGDTALHKACYWKFSGMNKMLGDIIKLLLEHGVDVNAKNKQGSTVLHLVSKNLRDISFTKLILNNSAKINEQDVLGNTSLHIAAKYKNVDLVKLLIDAGANVYLKNKDGEAILHLVVKHHLISCLDVLLKNYSEINSQSLKGNTCLHYAVSQKYLAVLKLLLLNNYININVKNEDKVTATCLAASQNFQSGVRLLLEREIHNNQINGCKEETLLYAVLKRNRTLIKRLIRRDININYKTNKSALHLAVLRNFEFGVEILIKAGAAVNYKDLDGNTPLHFAVIVKNATIINILLSNGAYVHSKNNDSRTAIHLASLSDFVEGVELLVDQGALLDHQDCDGNTPLHLAMSKENINSALVLIQSGARMDIVNGNEESFFSERKSKELFRDVETLFVKLKIAFAENSQSDYDAHRGVMGVDLISTTLRTECKEEASKIKAQCFGDKSLLDTLRDYEDPQFVLIGRLKALVESKSLEEDFPNFALLLKSRFKRLERRYNRVSEASAIPISIEISNKKISLPTEIKRKIMSKLSNNSLVSVLEALT